MEDRKKRISFSVPEDLYYALLDYAGNRGLRIYDLARLALFSYVRRSPPRNENLRKRLHAIF